VRRLGRLAEWIAKTVQKSNHELLRGYATPAPPYRKRWVGVGVGACRATPRCNVPH
jgi:hypothetical protein